MRRPTVAGALLLAMSAGSARAHASLGLVAARARSRAPISVFGPGRPLTETAWLLDGVDRDRRFKLNPDEFFPLLERFLEPERDRTPEWRSYLRGRYGARSWRFGLELSWAGSAELDDSELQPADALELRAPELDEPLDLSGAEVLPLWSLDVAPPPELLAVAAQRPCPPWRAPRTATVIRYDGNEAVRQPLVDCSGAIAADALDHLSVLARPAAAPRPELPLPLEPEGDALHGEWLPQVRLLHPRLIWLVQRIAEAFPGHAIYVVSGYRRDAHGFHTKGRALDLFVRGVDNRRLFHYCRQFPDAGCGFYPNNVFVHVDVRGFGAPRVAWVDVALPGEPSRYVDGWPGVLEAGAGWLGGE